MASRRSIGAAAALAVVVALLAGRWFAAMSGAGAAPAPAGDGTAAPLPAVVEAPNAGPASAQPRAAGIGAGRDDEPPCRDERLSIEAADGTRGSACVQAVDSRVDGVVRRHRYALRWQGDWLLEATVTAGRVEALRMLGRVPVGCVAEGCAGASSGLPDDDGAQPLQLVAVALGEGAARLRLSGRLRGAPGPGCLGEGLLVTFSEGGGGRFCPLGGAGDALLDDGRLELHFADLDGRELQLTMEPDGQRIAAIRFDGRYRCERRACAAASWLDGGPALGRRFRFADLVLADGERLATLSGELVLPAEDAPAD